MKMFLRAACPPALAALASLIGIQVVRAESNFQLQPIFTRYAATSEKVTLNTSARYFRDVQLEEADRFDGWTFDADLTIPFLDRFQARVFYPIYTEGRARVIEPAVPDRGRKIDIDGSGGVFDYPSLLLEAQLLDEKGHGVNFSVFGGVGYVFDFNSLDTTEAVEDVYNHQGKSALFGVRADKRVSDQLHLVGNLGGRYYWVSDDLNPAEADDTFGWMDASAAAIFRPFRFPIFPVAELAYQGDLDKYNSVLLVPELIYGANSHFELKAGMPIGLTSDGEQIGARIQATIRF